MLQVNIPFFAKTFYHASNLEVSLVSLLSGAASFGFTALLIYAGPPLKRGVQLSMALLAVGTAIMPLTPTLEYFILVSAVTSLGMGVQPLLLTTTTLAGEERARNISAFSAMLSLSVVVGPPYIFLISRLTHTDLLYSMAGITPLVLVGLYAYTASTGNLTLKPARMGLKDIARLLGNKRYVDGVLVMAAYTLAFTAFTTYGAILANARGATTLTAEIAITAFFATSLAARMLLAIKNRKTTPILVFASTIIGLLLTAYSANLQEAMLGFAALGVAHGVSYPLSSIYVAEAVGGEELAMANTLITGIDAALIFISLPILGYIAQNFGLTGVFLSPIPLTVALGVAMALNRTPKTPMENHHTD